MTRADAYAEGFSDGWRWAEHDLATHAGEWWRGESLEAAASSLTAQTRAFFLGAERGYRECHRRYEGGTHTRSMFELMPL